MKRSFSYILCAMTGSFLFALPFLRKDQRSLADIMSKTTVISDEEKAKVKVKLEIVEPPPLPAEEITEKKAA